MAGEQGFLYEQKINKILKDKGIQPKTFQSAGSDPVAPDGIFVVNGSTYKLEIKLDPSADFGQGSLDYDTVNKKWVLGGAKNVAGNEMRKLLTSVGAAEAANKEWGKFGAPNKFLIETKDFKQGHVDMDYKNFKDFFLDVPIDSVSNYYASKDTYYIQIGGGYGFYSLKEDPAKLGAPKFSPRLKLRIRLKRGGSNPINNYRFTTALQVATKPSRSPLNIELNFKV
jgi:hypothetical protein